MRLRKKWWARPEMESTDAFITNPQEQKGKWNEVFKNGNPIYLELGCGRGKFLTERAVNNEDINYIGIDLKDEVLIYGVKKAVEEEIKNVRFTALNISFVQDIFDEAEVSRIYINFCNPWPKERHKKRRLTHTRFLNQYRNFLKDDGQIWFKTDDDELFIESQEYFKEAGFSIEYITYDLHNSGFNDNVVTEYEKKFTALGIKTKFLIGKKL